MAHDIVQFIVLVVMVIGFFSLVAKMKSPGGQQIGGMVAEGLVKKFLK